MNRLTLFHSCQWDECSQCPELLPDPYCPDPEEPSMLVCGCECHVPSDLKLRRLQGA